jgi:hypothetical protein
MELSLRAGAMAGVYAPSSCQDDTNLGREPRSNHRWRGRHHPGMSFSLMAGAQELRLRVAECKPKLEPRGAISFAF